MFLEKARQLSLKTVNLQAGGQLAAFDKKAAFLNCLDEFQLNGNGSNGTAIHSNGKITGPVFKGKDVTIEPDVTLVGPVILSDGVHVKSGSVIRRSILGENTTVEKDQLVNNQIWLDQADVHRTDQSQDFSVNLDNISSPLKEYRKWPLFSYVRLGSEFLTSFVPRLF